MGITTVTEKERHLANILRTTTEALQAVTAERDALQSKNELFESALLKVRVSLGLNLHSNDDLLEVIDALKADSERIDYLAAMKKQTHSGDGGYLTELNFSHFSSLKRMNLRNSISAAMKGTS